MATSETIRNTLDEVIEQIPLVGGVPTGDYRTGANDKLPHEIFENWLPVNIDFTILPKRPATARFVLFGIGYTPEKYSPDERGKSKLFLRVGIPKNPNEYSSADRSHLSIARLTTQEVFDFYNSLARANGLEQMGLNNIIFFGDGHGPSVWVELLYKRLTSDSHDHYPLHLNTQDGGFVTYYPDGILALGGESRHLSPSSPFGAGEREIAIAKSAHDKNLELTKRIFEEFLTQEKLGHKVVIGDYRIVNEQFGYTQVMRPNN